MKPASPPKVKPLSAPQKAMRKLGLNRAIDLALHLPLRYEDETQITPLSQARAGLLVQIEGVVVASEVRITGRRQLLVTLDDGTDTCVMRFFSFYPSHLKALAVGQRIRARGELQGGLMGWTLMHPAFKPANGQLPTALTPVYPSANGLPQAYLRRAIDSGLDRADLRELWAENMNEIGLSNLPSLRSSLLFLHHPESHLALSDLQDQTHPAWQRLKFEELLAQQLSQCQARLQRKGRRAPCLPMREHGLQSQLTARLPFGLTRAQERVVREIGADLSRDAPMHRLLQGDVGAGKTVVAALAAAQAMDGGWQCVLMAPTEILAQQHFSKLVGWLEPMLAPRGLCVAWLTGSQKKGERIRMLAKIENGEAALVVGTHAVIQDQVRFARLGLAIIDEQHRFGVAQRLALRHKNQPEGNGLATDAEPHVLMMTATPIPRTLAMSYYADLDVSTLDELPPGRTPVVTKLFSDQRRAEVVSRVRAQVQLGRQVYWVCPLIEESEAMDLTNATQTHHLLSQAFKGVTDEKGHTVMVGLLHSRMPAAEKKAIMTLFQHGTMAVLVSTTVIEVGVDVPNASLMVIEHAERFGLSQLHQLRGRVGRGSVASACILLYSQPEGGRLSQAGRERLQAMVETQDGFEIARRDLDIRGPGEFLGSRQSGAALLRFADLSQDGHLLEIAQRCAPDWLVRFPEQSQQHIDRWLGGKSDFLKA